MKTPIKIRECPVCKKPNPRRGGHQQETCGHKCARMLAKINGKMAKNILAAHSENSCRKIAKTLTGHHGWGRSARDNQNHFSAKVYRIRTPEGKYIELKNLTSWCRKNKELFENWRNAQVGLTKVATGVRGSWHGWTAVCVFDIEGDPINRIQI